MSDTITRTEAEKIVGEYVTQVERTASIEPTANYLVGSLSGILAHIIKHHPDARETLVSHIKHLETEPSRP